MPFNNIYGKYLKERKIPNGTKFYWYRLSFVDIILFALIPMMVIYAFGSISNWGEVLGLKVIPMSGLGWTIFISITLLMLIHLTLNRKSVLKLQEGKVYFRKYKLIKKPYRFLQSDIARIDKKEESQFYESDTGYYPDIFKLYIYLKDGRKIRLGSFNQEDSERIKDVLLGNS